MSKRKDGRYESGGTSVWSKSPCKLRDTFAVAGWALKGTKFDGFYLAEEHNGKLVYAGKIEGGWTEEEKNDLLGRRTTSPILTTCCSCEASASAIAEYLRRDVLEVIWKIA